MSDQSQREQDGLAKWDALRTITLAKFVPAFHRRLQTILRQRSPTRTSKIRPLRLHKIWQIDSHIDV